MRLFIAFILVLGSIEWAAETYNRWDALDFRAAAAFLTVSMGGIYFALEEVAIWLEGRRG